MLLFAVPATIDSAYTPNSAGLLSAVDTGNGINYVTGATYGPDSGLTGFVSGNSGGFAGITNAFSYNKRLQPINMSATAPSQTVFSIGYDFHVGNGTSGSDNGNVWGITNYKDNTRNQSFTYDPLKDVVMRAVVSDTKPVNFTDKSSEAAPSHQDWRTMLTALRTTRPQHRP